MIGRRDPKPLEDVELSRPKPDEERKLGRAVGFMLVAVFVVSRIKLKLVPGGNVCDGALPWAGDGVAAAGAAGGSWVF